MPAGGSHPTGPTRMLLAKPVIAAVEGCWFARCLELATWCDLRVASQGSMFGALCRRWGVPLVDGGTTRPLRRIGHSQALDLILTGGRVYGTRRWGWSSQSSGSTRNDYDRSICACPRTCAASPTCPRHDRMTSYEQWSWDIPAALAHETKRDWRRSVQARRETKQFGLLQVGRHANSTRHE
jgi:enoyl-CoA hydratase